MSVSEIYGEFQYLKSQVAGFGQRINGLESDITTISLLSSRNNTDISTLKTRIHMMESIVGSLIQRITAIENANPPIVNVEDGDPQGGGKRKTRRNSKRAHRKSMRR